MGRVGRMGAWYVTAYGEIGESNQRLLMGKMGSFLLVLNSLNSLNSLISPVFPWATLVALRSVGCQLNQTSQTP